MGNTTTVTIGAVSGALTILLVWATQTFAGVTVPAEIASAFTTIFTAGVSWLWPSQKP